VAFEKEDKVEEKKPCEDLVCDVEKLNETKKDIDSLSVSHLYVYNQMQ